MGLSIKDVTEALDSVNIDRVELQFYGGGDSGSIESVRARSDGKWGESKLDELVWGPSGAGVMAAIEELAYNDVDASGVDWYNNDGGRCEWSIYKAIGGEGWRVSLEVYQYFMEQSLEHESDELVSELDDSSED